MNNFRQLHRLVATRLGGVVLFVLLFMALSLLMRVALLIECAGEAAWNASLAASFFWGLIFDVVTAGLFAMPLTLVLTLLPAGWFERRRGRVLMHVAGLGITAGLLFIAVAEWTFWDEFSVRFNFIAVDYLVYTTEVVANIRESYNLPVILGGIAVAALLIYGLLIRSGLVAVWMSSARAPWSRRWRAGAVWLVVPLVAGLLLDSRHLPEFRNDHNRELAKNGPWSFFAAFRHNELDYATFYPALPVGEAFARLRQELFADGAVPLNDNPHDTLRMIRNPGPELRPNIIQITVESLGTEFLGYFNPESKLTPELDALIPRSLVFEQVYATGTRTVRGMEATVLSLPPTPGRSIVKRPRHGNLFSFGSVLRSRGYDTAFIYSGFGYFDNMNAFFGNNGYRVVDRASVADEDITFANAWGACDEDLYNWTLREADRSAREGKPFHHFVMTTSNHRPFTFPEGRIDLPSKESGRAGAVKYTDYAIGKFLRDAAQRPWFKNTIFVIVADHCAESAGRTELPVHNYHIPLIIYAPGGQIKPGRVSTLMSQIDLPPTLLGLLNWSYPSRFYGRDVRNTRLPPRAFVGNYQRLGLLRDNVLTILKPVRQDSQYAVDPHQPTDRPEEAAVPELLKDTIAAYQTASYLYATNTYTALTPEEFARHESDRTAP